MRPVFPANLNKATRCFPVVLINAEAIAFQGQSLKKWRCPTESLSSWSSSSRESVALSIGFLWLFPSRSDASVKSSAWTERTAWVANGNTQTDECFLPPDRYLIVRSCLTSDSYCLRLGWISCKISGAFHRTTANHSTPLSTTLSFVNCYQYVRILQSKLKLYVDPTEQIFIAIFRHLLLTSIRWDVLSQPFK